MCKYMEKKGLDINNPDEIEIGFYEYCIALNSGWTKNELKNFIREDRKLSVKVEKDPQKYLGNTPKEKAISYINAEYAKYEKLDGRTEWFDKHFSTPDKRENYWIYLTKTLGIDETEILSEFEVESKDDFINNEINEDFKSKFLNGELKLDCYKKATERFICTDFTATYNNSPIEEQIIYLEALLESETNAKTTDAIIKATFNTRDDAEAVLKQLKELADGISIESTYENYKQAKASNSGEDTAASLHSHYVISRNKSFDRKQQDNTFIDEKLKEASKGNSTLSKEDIISFASSEMAATGTSVQLNEAEKKNAGTDLYYIVAANDDSADNKLTRYFLAETNNAVIQFSTSSNVTEEETSAHLQEVTAFMDEVTNNNYSIVVNDIQNGTTTELNPPAQSVNSNNNAAGNSVQSSEVVAQNTASAPVNTVNTTSTTENTSVEIVPEVTVQVAQAQVNNSVTTDNKETKQSQETAPASAKSFEAVAKSGIEAVKEYAKNNNLGAVKTALLILNTKTNSTSVMAFAINTFKAMSISVQRLAFEGIHNSSASKTIIDKALDSRLLCEIKGKNIWETEMIENRKEELKKQNPDACKSIFNSEVA